MPGRPDTFEIRQTKIGSWNIGLQSVEDDSLLVQANFAASDYVNASRWAFGAAARWSLLVSRPIRLVIPQGNPVYIITAVKE